MGTIVKNVHSTGDTMTGTLVLDNAGIDVKISSMDETVAPEVTKYNQPIEVYDKNGILMGHIEVSHEVSNTLYWLFGFYRTIDGTKKWQQYKFGVDANGGMINNLITYGSTAKTSGTSVLPTGTFYFQYE